MKKIGILEIFVICTLLLTGCGFKIVNNNKNKNIHIQKIELEGDKRITFLLKNQILLISSPQGRNKIKLNLQIDKNKKADSKNKQGKVDAYEASVSVKLTVKNKIINASEKMSLLKLIKSQLAKHALNIRKVEIQINDLSSERHGTLQQCKINILLPGLPSINVNTKGRSMLQAIKRALKSLQHILVNKYQPSQPSS